MYNTVLFDLDGTLTDPGIGITNSVMYALNKFGITVADRSELYCFIGPPLVDSFEKYYGFSKEQSLEALRLYREYFSVKGIYENELYSDTQKMLQTLKDAGKKLVLATSKPEEYAVEILRHFKIYDYFDFAAGATMDEKRNKKADVIAWAITQCGINDLSATVMVGDRCQDISGAAKNGIVSIGVLYGYGDMDELVTAGAVYIAENADDVTDIVLSGSKNRKVVSL